MITRVKYTYFASIALATSTLVIGYVLVNLIWGIPVVLAGATLWVWGDRRGRPWVGSVGLIFYLLIAAAGLLLSLAPGLAILSIVSAIVSWDIGRFNRLLGKVDLVNNVDAIEKRYRNRLLTVAMIGAVIAGLTPIIRVNFGFGIALLLGLTSVIGFSRAMIYLRRESN
jgi:hypothetical protein